jgi:hypothetical protein
MVGRAYRLPQAACKESMKRRSTRILDFDDAVHLLKSEIDKAGSQRRWAKENGVNRPMVCAALGGYRRLQPKILKALGLKKVDAYTWR